MRFAAASSATTRAVPGHPPACRSPRPALRSGSVPAPQCERSGLWSARSKTPVLPGDLRGTSPQALGTTVVHRPFIPRGCDVNVPGRAGRPTSPAACSRTARPRVSCEVDGFFGPARRIPRRATRPRRRRDDHGQRDLDVGVEPERDLGRPELLERLVERRACGGRPRCPACGLDRVGDVGRGDRAEQPAVLAGAGA